MDVLALNEKYKISNGTPGFYHFIFHKIHSKSFCVHRTRIDMQSYQLEAAVALSTGILLGDWLLELCQFNS